MRALPGILLLLAAAGCGSAAPRTAPATHDDFRAIQRHEATIEAHRRDATDSTAPCEASCPAAGSVCGAADEICRLADDTSDLDAIARCRRGRDACREARSVTDQRCDCDDG